MAARSIENFVSDIVEKRVIDMKHIRSNEQTADILTKSLPKDQHEKLTRKLGLFEFSYWIFYFSDCKLLNFDSLVFNIV